MPQGRCLRRRRLSREPSPGRDVTTGTPTGSRVGTVRPSGPDLSSFFGVHIGPYENPVVNGREFLFLDSRGVETT